MYVTFMKIRGTYILTYLRRHHHDFNFDDNELGRRWSSTHGSAFVRGRGSCPGGFVRSGANVLHSSTPYSN